MRFRFFYVTALRIWTGVSCRRFEPLPRQNEAGPSAKVSLAYSEVPTLNYAQWRNARYRHLGWHWQMTVDSDQWMVLLRTVVWRDRVRARRKIELGPPFRRSSALATALTVIALFFFSPVPCFAHRRTYIAFSGAARLFSFSLQLLSRPINLTRSVRASVCPTAFIVLNQYPARMWMHCVLFSDIRVLRLYRTDTNTNYIPHPVFWHCRFPLLYVGGS